MRCGIGMAFFFNFIHFVDVLHHPGRYLLLYRGFSAFGMATQWYEMIKDYEIDTVDINETGR